MRDKCNYRAANGRSQEGFPGSNQRYLLTGRPVPATVWIHPDRAILKEAGAGGKIWQRILPIYAQTEARTGPRSADEETCAFRTHGRWERKITHLRNSGKFRSSRDRVRQGINPTAATHGRPQQTVCPRSDGNISPRASAAPRPTPWRLRDVARRGHAFSMANKRRTPACHQRCPTHTYGQNPRQSHSRVGP